MLLQNDNVELHLSPERGGGVWSFRWRGHDVFHARPHSPGPLALGCFPLAPFSGRIAQGRFTSEGRDITLARNHPVDPGHPHPLHGFDWLSPFDIAESSKAHATFRRRRDPDEWPWAYETEQVFMLTKDGYRHGLSLTNRGASPMPAGLGLHPYFPRAAASLALNIDGIWETAKDQIPTRWRALAKPPEWLSRNAVDHCFTGRRGAISIHWPTHRLAIEPDEAFGFTVVFTPPNEDYFCVEPVSHVPDAVNRAEASELTGLRLLQPGERWATWTAFAVTER